MKNLRLITNLLLLLFVLSGSAQIVNKGVLHVSDSTSMYFESGFVNTENGIVNNNGTLHFAKKVTNNGEFESGSGKTLFKNTIKAEIKIDDVKAEDDLFMMSATDNQRINYLGQQTRRFQLHAVMPKVVEEGSVKDEHDLYIKKNNLDLIKTKKIKNTIYGTVELSKNDFIEVWEQRKIDDGSTIHETALTIILSD